jgi:hypothetical protein
MCVFTKRRPRELFPDHFRRHPTLRGIRSYTQHPNGRLLMIEDVGSGESLVMVLNWRAKVAQAFARDGGE